MLCLGMVLSAVFVFGSARSNAAESTWRGLYRNLLAFPIADGYDVYDTNLLRLDAYVTSLDESVRLRAIMDLSATAGSESALADGEALFPPESAFASGTELNLYRLYLQVRRRSWVGTAGRQRISWGTGLILRPSNPFEPPRFLEPFQESHGVNAFRLMLTPGQSVYMESVVRLDEAREGLQIALATGLRHPERFEIFGNVVRDTIHDRNQLGIALDIAKPIHFWFDGAHRYQYGVPHTTYDHETNVFLIEAGLDHRFDIREGLTLGIEYLFLSNGDPLGGGNDLNDAVMDYRLLQGPHYGVGLMSFSLNKTLSTRLEVIWNLVDASVVLRPVVKGWYTDALRLALGGLVYVGGRDTEFSRDDLGSARVKAVPFLQTAWSF